MERVRVDGAAEQARLEAEVEQLEVQLDPRTELPADLAPARPQREWLAAGVASLVILAGVHHPAVVLGVLLGPCVPEWNVLGRLERRLGELDVPRLHLRRSTAFLRRHQRHAAALLQRLCKRQLLRQLAILPGVGLYLLGLDADREGEGQPLLSAHALHRRWRHRPRRLRQGLSGADRDSLHLRRRGERGR